MLSDSLGWYRIKQERSDEFIRPEDRLYGHISTDGLHFVMSSGATLPASWFVKVPEPSWLTRQFQKLSAWWELRQLFKS